MKKSRKKRLRRIAERIVDRRRRRQSRGEVTGILRMTHSGYGFVTPDQEFADALDGDVFIPAKYVANALDGDQVRLELLPPRRGFESDASRGPSGRIVEVMERSRSGLVGELLAGSVLRPLDPRLPDNIRISGARRGAVRGDWVRVKLDEESGRDAHILEVIGRVGIISADLDAVMTEYELPPPYDEKAEMLAMETLPGEIARMECSEIFTLTVDPADAKDFDDALSLEDDPDSPEQLILGVHIADVAAYVPPRSKLDEWALERAFSCYLPGRTLPMLPAGLTAKISLQEGKPSLAHSVFIKVNAATGEVISAVRRHTVIRVDKRLDYDEVQNFIDSGEHPAEWDKQLTGKLKQLADLTGKMRRFREQTEKFIDLPLPEVRVICDEKNNTISSLSVKISREAENMVEEAMLAANQLVGRELIQRNVAGIFRIHNIPEADKTCEFSDVMQESFGLTPGDISNREVCRKFIASLPDDGRKNVILNLLLRAMPRAGYAVTPDIHFALGKSSYCHFTSPIRRYTDLLVHQQLWNHDRNARTRNSRTVERVAQWCTDREELIDNACFAASDRMKLRYLADLFEREADRVYEGVIVKVLNSGLQVDIGELGLYGFVSQERLRGSYYRRRSRSAEADRTLYKVGNYIYLRLDNIDMARGVANFVPAGR